MKDLLFRCSELGLICNGKFGLTEIQQKNLDELKQKPKLTDNQLKTLNDLELKLNAPPSLSQTSISKIESIVKQDVYGYKVQIDNKFVNKGIRMEDEAIELLNLIYNKEYKKNTNFFKNDFISGTPDIIDGNKIIDVKCPFSKVTFPVFADEAHNVLYEYQMRGYMMLTGCESAEVTYCLMNTPIDLISYKNKDDERIFTEQLDIHNVDDLDLRYRTTTYTYYRDLDIEKEIIEMCKIAKDYQEQYYNLLIFKNA